MASDLCNGNGSADHDDQEADWADRRGRELAYQAVTAHLLNDPDRVSTLMDKMFEDWALVPYTLIALIEGASSTAEMWAESQKVKPTAAGVRFAEVMMDIRYAPDSAVATSDLLELTGSAPVSPDRRGVDWTDTRDETRQARAARHAGR